MANTVTQLNTVAGVFTIQDDNSATISVTGPASAFFTYLGNTAANLVMHQTAFEGAINFALGFSRDSISLGVSNTQANIATTELGMLNTLANIAATDILTLNTLNTISGTHTSLETDIKILSNRGSNLQQGIVVNRVAWGYLALDNRSMIRMGLESNGIANAYVYWANQEASGNTLQGEFLV